MASKNFHPARDTVQRTLQASKHDNGFVERATVIESTDGVSLEVAVTPGSESVDVAALICHPWGRIGGSMRDSVVVSLRNVLSGEGFTVCRFNFRGVGASTGSIGITGAGERSDVQAVCRFLLSGASIGGEGRRDIRRVLLVGYSYGAIIAGSCADLDGVCAAAAVSYPFSYAWALVAWNAGGYWDTLRRSARPGLMVCGSDDAFCSRERFEREVAGASAAMESKCFAGADHFWSGAQFDVARFVADWAARTVLHRTPAARSPRRAAPVSESGGSLPG